MRKISSGWRRVTNLIRDVLCKSASKEAVRDSSSELETLFAESATRPAGDRQAQSINGEEYGFRWIPPGEFDMGSPESEEGRRDNEKRRHVKLTHGFWLLETPITQRLYESVMGENPSEFGEFIFTKSFGESETFDGVLTCALKDCLFGLPAVCISYDDVLAFCEKLTVVLPCNLTATLPTEAEWEYACRAGSAVPFGLGIA